MNPLFIDVVNNYNPDQGKLSIMCSGCGTQLSNLQGVPGASRIMHGIMLPYSEAMLLELLSGRRREYVAPPAGFKAMSKEVADMMAIRARLLTKDTNAVGIGITGALTTNRWRKGENGFFLSVSFRNNGGEVIVKSYPFYNLGKLDEETYRSGLTDKEIQQIRTEEENKISTLVFNLIFSASTEGWGNINELSY